MPPEGAARARNSIAWPRFSPPWNSTQTPPPPRLTREGRVTAMAKYIATAASTAVPPLPSTSRPISTARGSSPATTPAKPSTGAKMPGSRCSQAPSSSVETSSAASGARFPKRQTR